MKNTTDALQTANVYAVIYKITVKISYYDKNSTGL